jgi:hypothetical protein
MIRNILFIKFMIIIKKHINLLEDKKNMENFNKVSNPIVGKRYISRVESAK